MRVFKKVILSSAIGLLGAISFPMVAGATPVNGCSFTVAPSVWTLDADCTSTAQIDVPTSVTLNGAGHTISSPFTKVDETNNSAIGILSDNVTVKNLTLDGTGGVNLHGINVYVAANVTISNVTIKNSARFGIVVNGSTVSVSNVTTSGNGWGGIDVDQGGGVTAPAILNIVGNMVQTDVAQIYVDNTTKSVTVNDNLSQYTSVDPVTSPDAPNDRLYTLKSPSTKDQCKNGNWKTFTSPKFKNQGKCVDFVEHLREKEKDHRDSDKDHHENENDDRLENHPKF